MKRDEQFYRDKYPYIGFVCDAINAPFLSTCRKLEKTIERGLFSRKKVDAFLDRIEQKLKDIGQEDINWQINYAKIFGYDLYGDMNATKRLKRFFMKDEPLFGEVTEKANKVPKELRIQLRGVAENGENRGITGGRFFEDAEIYNARRRQLELLLAIYRNPEWRSKIPDIKDLSQIKKFKKSYAKLFSLAWSFVYTHEDSNNVLKIRLSKQSEIATKLHNFDALTSSSELPPYYDNEALRAFDIRQQDFERYEKMILDGLLTIKEERAMDAVYRNHGLTDISQIPKNEELSQELGVTILETGGEAVQFLTHITDLRTLGKIFCSSIPRQEIVEKNRSMPAEQYSRIYRMRIMSLYKPKGKQHDAEHTMQISAAYFDTSIQKRNTYTPIAGSVIHIFNGVPAIQIQSLGLDTPVISHIMQVSKPENFDNSGSQRSEVTIALEPLRKVKDEEGFASLEKDASGELIKPTALLAILSDEHPKIPEETIICAKAWRVPVIVMHSGHYPNLNMGEQRNPPPKRVTEKTIKKLELTLTT